MIMCVNEIMAAWYDAGFSGTYVIKPVTRVFNIDGGHEEICSLSSCGSAL
jgi:hypothetical protein